MTIPRIIYDVSGLTTYIVSEREIESWWSHPNVPLLVFNDSALPGTSVDFHGGPIGSGMPVQLLFWGGWWNSADGIARRVLIESRVQAVLASDYFSELAQYGIERPHWRGATIVIQPGPPMAFNSDDDVQAVPDLIDDLIDDDVFPDPDDEKIAFIVFMPGGFTQTIGAFGQHTNDYDYNFPFDKDWYWVAWVSTPTPDPEDTVAVFTHELVELLSDPESDGWYANNSEKGEIADAAVKGGGQLGQTAWVNGAHVTAYWSNRHSATVIPIDRDYRARIVGSIKVNHSEQIHGTFRPGADDTRLCDIEPECCLEDRDYSLTIVKHDETALLRVETQRYRQPVFAWTVGGISVTKDTTLSLNVIAGTYEGRVAKFGNKTVKLICRLSNNSIALQTIGIGANFDVTVDCSVTDGSITGNVRTNVIAKPSLIVGFAGAELKLDPVYTKNREKCIKALTRKFRGLNKSEIGYPKPPGPVEIDLGVLSDIPAYARLGEYRRARRALTIALLADVVHSKETARAITASLMLDNPALKAALATRSQRSKGD